MPSARGYRPRSGPDSLHLRRVSFAYTCYLPQSTILRKSCPHDGPQLPSCIGSELWTELTVRAMVEPGDENVHTTRGVCGWRTAHLSADLGRSRARDRTVTGRCTSASYAVLGTSRRGGIYGALRPDRGGHPGKGKGHTIVVSQTLQHYYRERHGRSTVYVPNGAILRPKHTPKRLGEWGLTPDNYVLYLGRLSPEKNCHLLIEAFEEIATGMRLVLAGGSSHSDEYVESLRRHESEQIRLLPWVSARIWMSCCRTQRCSCCPPILKACRSPCWTRWPRVCAR